MPSKPNPLRSRWALALGLLGPLLAPQAAHAGFEVTYLFTDAEGNPLTNTRLTANDMTSYVNQASCQCGETFAARVFLNNNDGSGYSASSRVITYVGTACDEAQQAISNFGPCVKVYEGLANDYDDGGIFIDFEQVWLSSAAQGTNIDVSQADPVSPCSNGQIGAGKIWICVDSNGDSKCLSDEFISPTTLNSTGESTTPTDPTANGGANAAGSDGINYDYLPPQDSVTGFSASPGDGAVVLSWGREEVDDIQGFRILCADADGNPAKTGDDKVVKAAPTGQARTNGTFYYTAESLCGGDVVYTPDPNEIPETPEEGGTTTGSDDGRDTGDEGLTSAGFDAAWGEPWSYGGTITSGVGSDSGGTGGTGSTSDASGTTGAGETSGGASDTGATDAGGSDTTGGSGTVGTGEGIESLHWDYVCTGHIAANTTTARINGLQNGEAYQFLVVAYDRSGNPKVMSDLLTETPIRTDDFWERCEAQGDLCGDGGFCHCRSDATTPPAAWSIGLLALLLMRRRREGSR